MVSVLISLYAMKDLAIGSEAIIVDSRNGPSPAPMEFSQLLSQSFSQDNLMNST